MCKLTPEETRLFLVLGNGQGRHWSVHELCEILYMDDANGGPEDKIICVRISEIRKKIANFGGWRIVTEYCKGYRLERIA